MKIRFLIMVLITLGIFCPETGESAPVSGAIRVVKEELPSAKIIVTGKAFAPRKAGLTPVQKKLLAERASLVDAYRVMTATLKGVCGHIQEGSGFIQTSGYIRGAEIENIRYFIDGKVETDLSLPVVFYVKEAGKRIDWDTVISDISNSGCPIYYIEKQPKQISEAEWLEMQK